MTEFLPMITERRGVPVTTSRAVAEQFGKQHKNVMRDIENLLRDLTSPKLDSLEDQPKIGHISAEKDQLKIEPISDGAEFARNNFMEASYNDQYGREQPMYLMTRDGFTILAMGFTGARALQFKVAYIDAFNRMEQIIRNGTNAAALTHFEERLQALEGTAGSGNGEVTDTVAFSFLQALQEAIDSGEYYIKTRKEEAPRGKFLGFIERDCIALHKRTAYNIYASKVKDPLPHGALWRILQQSGTAFPDGYRCESMKFKKCHFRAIYIKPDRLRRKAAKK